MDFRPLDRLTRENLAAALRSNAIGNTALLMDPRDTTYVGSATEVPDEEVVNAVASVPVHY